MMGTWIVLGVLVIGVVMALLTVRKASKEAAAQAAARMLRQLSMSFRWWQVRCTESIFPLISSYLPLQYLP